MGNTQVYPPLSSQLKNNEDFTFYFNSHSDNEFFKYLPMRMKSRIEYKKEVLPKNARSDLKIDCKYLDYVKFGPSGLCFTSIRRREEQ